MSDWLGPCWHGVDLWRECKECRVLPEATVVAVSLGAEVSELSRRLGAAEAKIASHLLGADLVDGLEAASRRGELLDVIEAIEWMGPPVDGDTTCPYCGARSFDKGDGPHRRHERGCIVANALADRSRARPLTDERQE